MKTYFLFLILFISGDKKREKLMKQSNIKSSLGIEINSVVLFPEFFGFPKRDKIVFSEISPKINVRKYMNVITKYDSWIFLEFSKNTLLFLGNSRKIGKNGQPRIFQRARSSELNWKIMSLLSKIQLFFLRTSIFCKINVRYSLTKLQITLRGKGDWSNMFTVDA